jgi:hypothetical protein
MSQKLQKLLLSFAVGFVILTSHQLAKADLVQPVVAVDNSTAFRGSLTVTQFTIATYTFSSTNWLITVREDFIGSEVLPNGFEIKAQHLVSPDAGGTTPNPQTLTLILFANSFTPGGPAQGPFTTSLAHDQTFDFLTVSYVPSAQGQSQINIQTSHGSPVPEPASGALFCLAMFTAGFLKRKGKLWIDRGQTELPSPSGKHVTICAVECAKRG